VHQADPISIGQRVRLVVLACWGARLAWMLGYQCVAYLWALAAVSRGVRPAHFQQSTLAVALPVAVCWPTWLTERVAQALSAVWVPVVVAVMT
jgi:hypothetical protein